MSTASDQLAGELEIVTGNVSAVLGMDLEQLLRERAWGRADALVSSLGLDEPDSYQTAVDLMHVLFGQAEPEPEWWTSPLGLLCAAALGDGDEHRISQQAAAEMLGVTRGTVAQMVARGNLDRHPDGGVLRSSVFAVLIRRARKP